MSRYGWCLTGHHDQCRVQVGEQQPCTCDCHVEPVEIAPTDAEAAEGAMQAEDRYIHTYLLGGRE